MLRTPLGHLQAHEPPPTTAVGSAAGFARGRRSNRPMSGTLKAGRPGLLRCPGSAGAIDALGRAIRSYPSQSSPSGRPRVPASAHGRCPGFRASSDDHPIAQREFLRRGGAGRASRCRAQEGGRLQLARRCMELASPSGQSRGADLAVTPDGRDHFDLDRGAPRAVRVHEHDPVARLDPSKMGSPLPASANSPRPCSPGQGSAKSVVARSLSSRK